MYEFDENRDGNLSKIEAYNMATEIMGGEISENWIDKILK